MTSPASAGLAALAIAIFGPKRFQREILKPVQNAVGDQASQLWADLARQCANRSVAWSAAPKVPSGRDHRYKTFKVGFGHFSVLNASLAQARVRRLKMIETFQGMKFRNLRRTPAKAEGGGTMDSAPSRIAFDLKQAQKPVFHALLEARDKFGGTTPAIVDGDRRTLSYNELNSCLFRAGRCPGRRQAPAPANNVGVLLPTGLGAAIAFFALSAYGRVPTMLNFTAGTASLKKRD